MAFGTLVGHCFASGKHFFDGDSTQRALAVALAVQVLGVFGLDRGLKLGLVSEIGIGLAVMDQPIPLNDLINATSLEPEFL